MRMPDTNTKNLDNVKQNGTQKKHSFFWWEINEKTKDLLDFRYNTQEEIDKLNDQMTVTNDLDEIIKQTNNPEINEDIDNEDEEYIKNKDEEDAESGLEENLQSINESLDNDGKNDNYDEVYEEQNEPIEWEIVEDSSKNEEDTEISENNSEEITEKIETKDNEEVEDESEKVQDEEKNESEEESKTEDKNEDNVEEPELSDTAKFFDPFELGFDDNDEEVQDENEELEDDNEEAEDENEEVQDETEEVEDETEEIEDETEEVQDENEEIEDQTEEVEDQTEEVEDENEEEVENENEEVEDENEEVEDENEEVEDENEEVEDENEENNEEEDKEDDNEDLIINTTIPVNPNKEEKEEKIDHKKTKKNSATWETLTDEEIKLEQWQDMSDTEDEEAYQPSAEEIFEQEPEFFADDELSQQFMHLIQNVRAIFKLERKDWEQDPYFKILWWKTEDSTIEYLFYLIEEENEPIDLYIKKVETNQDNEENEHLVQFSYNEEKELNIFVDEIILYEKVNKSDYDSVEYNDTKAILEKFIFLTDNQYSKLKSELDKLREEKQKKKQLQQIFKGF